MIKKMNKRGVLILHIITVTIKCPLILADSNKYVITHEVLLAAREHDHLQTIT